MQELRKLFLSVAVALALPVAGALAVEAAPADPTVKPAEVKADQGVNGLQMTVLLKERTIQARGGDNGAETKIKVLTVQLKNVGDKPVVLGFQVSGGMGGMGGFGGRGGPQQESPIKGFAKDAAGKDVPKPEQPAAREDQPKPEERPAQLTVLKPGQTVEQALGIRFPNDGKYTVWAELEVKAGDEVLPGVKPWSGKLKSNELEYDYKNPFGGNNGNRGNRGNRGGGQNPAPAPAPAPAPGEKENF